MYVFRDWVLFALRWRLGNWKNWHEIPTTSPVKQVRDLYLLKMKLTHDTHLLPLPCEVVKLKVEYEEGDCVLRQHELPATSNLCKQQAMC